MKELLKYFLRGLESIESLPFRKFVSSINESDSLMNGHTLMTEDFQRIYSWNEISRIHRVRHGIYQRNGELISLLTDFGKINPCYPDIHGETTDTIFYTGAGRRGDQQLDSFNQAMFNAIESKHAVPLFNKLAVGRWEFMGFWRVTEGVYVYDEAQTRMIWKFTLERSSGK